MDLNLWNVSVRWKVKIVEFPPLSNPFLRLCSCMSLFVCFQISVSFKKMWTGTFIKQKYVILPVPPSPTPLKRSKVDKGSNLNISLFLFVCLLHFKKIIYKYRCTWIYNVIWRGLYAQVSSGQRCLFVVLIANFVVHWKHEL
jgi:hypothetical protein